jgi:hypothetical protein
LFKNVPAQHCGRLSKQALRGRSVAAGRQTSKLKVAGSNPAGVATSLFYSFSFNYLEDVLSSGSEVLDNFSSLFVLAIPFAIACSASRDWSAALV